MGEVVACPPEEVEVLVAAASNVRIEFTSISQRLELVEQRPALKAACVAVALECSDKLDESARRHPENQPARSDASRRP